LGAIVIGNLEKIEDALVDRFAFIFNQERDDFWTIIDLILDCSGIQCLHDNNIFLLEFKAANMFGDFLITINKYIPNIKVVDFESSMLVVVIKLMVS
jgi:hypothetical protein